MKSLLDTNIVIPLVPTAVSWAERETLAAAKLARLASEGCHQLYVHPESSSDIKRDTDAGRRRLRTLLFSNYPPLASPPPVSPALEAVVGPSLPGTNDWVDNHLLAAVAADAVDYLVTEDRRLRNKAARAGMQDRVATLAEAVSVIQDLFDVAPPPPPAIHQVKAHELSTEDPMFDSFRQDYLPFDPWLGRCKREHRDAWVIRGDPPRLAAVCIVKREQGPELGLQGKLLEICGFKVSEEYNGLRFGELLLKTVFAYAERNRHDWLYTTVFEKYGGLVFLLEELGFRSTGAHTEARGAVFAKPMRAAPAEMERLDPLEFHVRYGPSALNFAGAPAFLIPIKPEFHRLLFPQAERQLELMPGACPFWNSIRKAYLYTAAVRTISRGASLLFYRSADAQAVTAIGIAEDTLVSYSAHEIARFVGKRTVYSFHEIERLCASHVLAILFRQVRLLGNPISLHAVMANWVVAAAPQSIVTVSEVAKRWLYPRLD